VKPIRIAFAVALAAAALAGCGEKEETLGDETAVFGPGVTATQPPWEPEYSRLEARIKQLGLPPVGDERYHSHALLHIYNDGLLVEVPESVGFDERNKVYSSVHTHEPNGVVHMESSKPHKFTLGEFFTIWGVRFGSKTLGSLTNDSDKQVHVFVNGKRIQNPVDHVMREGDNISIGYGAADSFPHEPDTKPLESVTGKGKQSSCSSDPEKGDESKGCVDTGRS
jgi:hypothetical protein